MSRAKYFTTAVAIFLLSHAAAAQSKVDPAKHEQKVKDMVAFFEYVLNTLGSASTPASDKDVLVTESYTKIFRDAKVQIEDDLVEKRNVITNKDVPAYLKDVDFFFKDVHFEFHITKIVGKVNANGTLFYKVALTRNLKGTTIEGKAINNTVPRFIEINYDPSAQDLKIVSIYTNEFNEKESLTNWWKGLSLEWQTIFKRKLNVVDTVGLEDIKNMMDITSLDISDNAVIRNIEPLSSLSNLQTLDISKTRVTDLAPVRNLTALIDLNMSGVNVMDLSALRYADKMIHLDISHTPTTDISVLEKMPVLEALDLSHTPVQDFAILSSLPELKQLRLDETSINDLSVLGNLTKLTDVSFAMTSVSALTPLSALANLTDIKFDSTSVADVSPLASNNNLQVISMNHTRVSSLEPLRFLRRLQHVYCDHTNITKTMADAFMSAHPGMLVIVNSADLQEWWSSIGSEWQRVLSRAANTSTTPSKESLVVISNLDSINVNNNSAIHDVTPLRKLVRLRTLRIAKTQVSDLSPLADLPGITLLDITATPIKDIAAISAWKKLRRLKASQTHIESIAPLTQIKSLQFLNVDSTGINDANVHDFLSTHTDVLIVYKSDRLEQWWDVLSPEWKDIFTHQVTIRASSHREDLHRLIEIETVTFSDVDIDDLSPLKEFVRLKALHFSGTSVTNFDVLSSLTSLRSLSATHGPLHSLESLGGMTQLESLDISNTAVEDLRPIQAFGKLKSLNFSGTPVKELKPLNGLQSLESLDCSNTEVRSLEPINGLPIKTLKCYNTKVSSKRIEKFKQDHPECKVMYYR